MGLSKEELKYYMTNFRTRRSYMLFHVFQVILSFLIMACALTSAEHFRQASVLWMEFVLLLCMTFDLVIVRGISEGALWTSRHNKIDCVILIFFSLTFLFLLFSEKKREGTPSNKPSSLGEVFLEADDIIIIAVVLGRYGVQIWQAIKIIRNTRKNMIIQRNIKDVDLNNKDANMSVAYEDDMRQDEIFRSKLSKKHEQGAIVSEE